MRRSPSAIVASVMRIASPTRRAGPRRPAPAQRSTVASRRTPSRRMAARARRKGRLSSSAEARASSEQAGADVTQPVGHRGQRDADRRRPPGGPGPRRPGASERSTVATRTPSRRMAARARRKGRLSSSAGLRASSEQAGADVTQPVGHRGQRDADGVAHPAGRGRDGLGQRTGRSRAGAPPAGAWRRGPGGRGRLSSSAVARASTQQAGADATQPVGHRGQRDADRVAHPAGRGRDGLRQRAEHGRERRGTRISALTMERESVIHVRTNGNANQVRTRTTRESRGGGASVGVIGGLPPKPSLSSSSSASAPFRSARSATRSEGCRLRGPVHRRPRGVAVFAAQRSCERIICRVSVSMASGARRRSAILAGLTGA